MDESELVTTVCREESPGPYRVCVLSLSRLMRLISFVRFSWCVLAGGILVAGILSYI